MKQTKKLLILFVFLFLITFSTQEKMLTKKIYEVISDPLVQKLAEKINPIKEEEVFIEQKEYFNQEEIPKKKKSLSFTNLEQQETTKTCFNGGIPVFYIQGNSTHNITSQACICPLHTYFHHCGYFRLHKCTNQLKYPLRSCEYPQG